MTTTNQDLLAHCHQKAAAVTAEAWRAALERYAEPTNSSPQPHGGDGSERSHSHHPDDNNDDRRRDAQGAIARMTHVQLLLQRIRRQQQQNGDVTDSNQEEPSSSADSIIQRYVEYQRKVLRQRAKPAIAALVQERRQGTFENPAGTLRPHTAFVVFGRNGGRGQ